MSMTRLPFRSNSKLLFSSRQLSTSFADLYRNSIESAPLTPGDTIQGHIVGKRRPRSSSSRFYIVDFGLKSEVPFSAKEIPGLSVIGDDVSMPLVALEDDFNEPVFDQDRRSEMPVLQAERYELLTMVAKSDVRILHGRYANFKRVGATAKVLGTDAFVPRHHVVALDRPLLGSYAPFYVLNLSTEKSPGGSPTLDVNPVVSSYGAYLFTIANLVGIDSSWANSGGGTPQERLGYLRLLTRLLHQKNAAVRRLLPKATFTRGGQSLSKRKMSDSHQSDSGGTQTAWLKDLASGQWVSSAGKKRSSGDRSSDGRRGNAFRHQRVDLKSDNRARTLLQKRRPVSKSLGLDKDLF